jgi:hypothetical protein
MVDAMMTWRQQFSSENAIGADAARAAQGASARSSVAG